MLELVLGSSALSLGLLLGTFMGGLSLGSFLFPSAVSGARHALRVYALVELGIGVIGVAILAGFIRTDRPSCWHALLSVRADQTLFVRTMEGPAGLNVYQAGPRHRNHSLEESSLR